MTDIEIVAEPRTSVNVTLVGVAYRALPPKTLVAIDFGKKLKEADKDPDKTIAEIEKWLSGIFGRKVAPEIIQRLKDPADQLDLKHIMELIKALMAKVTGNPPTSPSDS